MPIEWKIDHANRLVIATCRGTLSRLEIEQYLDKVVVEGALPFRKIFDITNATSALADGDMMALGARIRAYDGISEMGPLVIVAATPEGEDLARRFVNLAGASRPTRVVGTVLAAQRWLDQQTLGNSRPTRSPSTLRSLLAL
jgi:hypothetical protein